MKKMTMVKGYLLVFSTLSAVALLGAPPKLIGGFRKNTDTVAVLTDEDQFVSENLTNPVRVRIVNGYDRS